MGLVQSSNEIRLTESALNSASESMTGLQGQVKAIGDTLLQESTTLSNAFICEEDNASARLANLLERVTNDVNTVGTNMGVIAEDMQTVKRMAIATDELAQSVAEGTAV